MIRFDAAMHLPAMALSLVLAVNVAPQTGRTATSARLPVPKENTRAVKQATGTFSVKMLPPPTGETSFVRLLLVKEFDGGLQGMSQVEMLASNGGDQPEGGYVALERFTGELSGREGSFVMQHSGTMSARSTSVQVVVTPGSGTGALTGIEGTLVIRQEGKRHFYDLKYSLPGVE